jgi:hypothetical protein
MRRTGMRGMRRTGMRRTTQDRHEGGQERQERTGIEGGQRA